MFQRAIKVEYKAQVEALAANYTHESRENQASHPFPAPAYDCAVPCSNASERSNQQLELLPNHERNQSPQPLGRNRRRSGSPRQFQWIQFPAKLSHSNHKRRRSNLPTIRHTECRRIFDLLRCRNIFGSFDSRLRFLERRTSLFPLL